MCASQQKLYLSAIVLSKCYQLNFWSWYFLDIIASEGFTLSSLLYLEVEAIGGGKVGHHF